VQEIERLGMRVSLAQQQANQLYHVQTRIKTPRIGAKGKMRDRLGKLKQRSHRSGRWLRKYDLTFAQQIQSPSRLALGALGALCQDAQDTGMARKKP
jgi:hypothetical protein